MLSINSASHCSTVRESQQAQPLLNRSSTAPLPLLYSHSCCFFPLVPNPANTLPQGSTSHLPPSPLPEMEPPETLTTTGVGKYLRDSFAIIIYSLKEGHKATKRQVKRYYMEPTSKFYLDKNIPEESGQSHKEATKCFQLQNNTHSHLYDFL